MPASLYQIVCEWLQSNQLEGKYNGWISDDIIWKPFHRYWFSINVNGVEALDKGPSNPNYAIREDAVRISAADPYFFEKLGALLTLRA